MIKYASHTLDFPAVLLEFKFNRIICMQSLVPCPHPLVVRLSGLVHVFTLLLDLASHHPEFWEVLVVFQGLSAQLLGSVYVSQHPLQLHWFHKYLKRLEIHTRCLDRKYKQTLGTTTWNILIIGLYKNICVTKWNNTKSRRFIGWPKKKSVHMGFSQTYLHWYEKSILQIRQIQKDVLLYFDTNMFILLIHKYIILCIIKFMVKLLNIKPQ